MLLGFLHPVFFMQPRRSMFCVARPGILKSGGFSYWHWLLTISPTPIHNCGSKTIRFLWLTGYVLEYFLYVLDSKMESSSYLLFEYAFNSAVLEYITIWVFLNIWQSTRLPWSILSGRLTPLASSPEQSRAAWRVHAASIPWQSRCCSRPTTSTRWYRYI